LVSHEVHQPRPYSDPAVAARKLLEIANATEAVQDGRIYIQKINGQFLFKEDGTPEEYSAGLKFAIDQGWLLKHESGTYVKFTPAGAMPIRRGLCQQAETCSTRAWRLSPSSPTAASTRSRSTPGLTGGIR
jgi:hypothetical protein